MTASTFFLAVLATPTVIILLVLAAVALLLFLGWLLVFIQQWRGRSRWRARVQDMQAFFWSEPQIVTELDRIMDRAIADVAAMAAAERVDMRAAAMMVAVSRVAEATALRGLYP